MDQLNGIKREDSANKNDQNKKNSRQSKRSKTNYNKNNKESTATLDTHGEFDTQNFNIANLEDFVPTQHVRSVQIQKFLALKNLKRVNKKREKREEEFKKKNINGNNNNNNNNSTNNTIKRAPTANSGTHSS